MEGKFFPYYILCSILLPKGHSHLYDMKSTLIAIAVLLFSLNAQGKDHSLLIETESFKDKGGWVIDQQSMEVIGSPYLMAHGMGIPVEDASTTIVLPKKGTYRVYVRTRNWTAPWSDKAAGLFQVLINGKAIDWEFGSGNPEWTWVDGGIVTVDEVQVEISSA